MKSKNNSAKRKISYLKKNIAKHEAILNSLKQELSNVETNGIIFPKNICAYQNMVFVGLCYVCDVCFNDFDCDDQEWLFFEKDDTDHGWNNSHICPNCFPQFGPELYELLKLYKGEKREIFEETVNMSKPIENKNACDLIHKIIDKYNEKKSI